jgi:hypothetical protein
MRNEMVIDQLILFHKPNKKVRSEKMVEYFISQTKHTINVPESCLEGGWIGKLKLFQQKLEANWVKLNWSRNSPS